MKTVVTLALVTAGLLCAPPRAARAFCTQHTWPSGATIEVVLNDNAGLLCSNGASTCSGIDDVERVLQVVLDEFYDNGGSGLRFVYAGRVSTLDQYVAGKLHIHVSSCLYGAPASATHVDTDEDTF